MSEIQLVLKICKYSSFHFVIIESSLNVRSCFLCAWRPNILKISHARNIPTSAIQDSGSIKQEAKIKPALRQSLNLPLFVA